ncbi:MAG: hypothetical protein D6696_16670 [Acidobacteria bacterium]|nr:MAG: hypothetical protein D6696_16670 [Acidobacteriota bacterium]
MSDLTCRELADFLLDYLEGELPAAQARTFADHLAACPACESYLDSYRRTVALERQAFADDDCDVPEELVQAILAARRA